MRSNGLAKQCGEGVPGRGHPDRNREGDGAEDQWRSPHGGAVDAANRDEFVDDEDEKHYAKASDGSRGGWKSDAGPRKAAESCGNETHCGNQNKTLVGVGPAPGAPRSIIDDDEADDADQRDGSGNGRIERADHPPKD